MVCSSATTTDQPESSEKVRSMAPEISAIVCEGQEVGAGVGALVGVMVGATVGSGEGAGVGAAVVVVDAPGLRGNANTLAVGRRRKDSKAHLPPEMETDYPYLTVVEMVNMMKRDKQLKS